MEERPCLFIFMIIFIGGVETSLHFLKPLPVEGCHAFLRLRGSLPRGGAAGTAIGPCSLAQCTTCASSIVCAPAALAGQPQCCTAVRAHTAGVASTRHKISGARQDGGYGRHGGGAPHSQRVCPGKQSSPSRAAARGGKSQGPSRSTQCGAVRRRDSRGGVRPRE